MSTKKLWMAAAAALLWVTSAASIANAQATRTWVSGVGDDANPCSRTAPCKTFAGAISKTAAGGEINVLDPGGFGAVTITKSITISSESFEAGVLVSGTNGIVISAANTDNIVLRGLDIEGLGTGLAGIKVLSAGNVYVEKCTINHFTQSGIEFVPSSATTSTSNLYVSSTIVRNNVGAAGFAGIHVKPGSNVTGKATISNTLIEGNSAGLRVEDNSTTVANDTTAASNSGAGLIAVTSGLGTATLNLEGCVASSNGFGIRADAGSGGTANVRISNCDIFGNTTGLSTNGVNAHIQSFSNNKNTDTGTPNGPNIGPQ